MALLPEPILEEKTASPPTPKPKKTAPPTSKKPGSKLQIFLIFTFLIVVILVGYFFWAAKLGKPKIAAKVGNEKITLGSVAETAEDCNLSQKEAVELLVDEKVLSLWAKDEQVTLSPEEQEEAEILIGGGAKLGDQCITHQAKVNLLRKKLFQNITQSREGKLIVANFGLYNPNLFLPIPGVKSEEQREKLLQEDRRYADNLIRSIYSDLKEKKITFDEALVKVQNDPNIGLESKYQTSLQSGEFTASDYVEQQGLLNFDDVKERIDSLSPGDFSKPFIQKVSTGIEEDHGELVDARWIIAKVERVGKGYGGTEKDLLGKIRKQYHTRIFLK